MMFLALIFVLKPYLHRLKHRFSDWIILLICVMSSDWFRLLSKIIKMTLKTTWSMWLISFRSLCILSFMCMFWNSASFRSLWWSIVGWSWRLIILDVVLLFYTELRFWPVVPVFLHIYSRAKGDLRLPLGTLRIDTCFVVGKIQVERDRFDSVLGHVIQRQSVSGSLIHILSIIILHCFVHKVLFWRLNLWLHMNLRFLRCLARSSLGSSKPIVRLSLRVKSCSGAQNCIWSFLFCIWPICLLFLDKLLQFFS